MRKLLVILLLFISGNFYAQTTLIPFGSSWKYLDNGSNQSTAWRAVAFNDAAWASGNAQLGYGDGDEATVVSYGPNPNNKYVTTYFRKTIAVANATAFTSFTLNVKRDDGVIVYINGTQRFKNNMPNGNISYTTKASSDAADDGNTAQTINLAVGTLITGNNVIAVEIHQRTVTSSDISFDLQLTGNGDLAAPVVNTFSPTDNAVNVAVNSNLVLTFNETIQKGTGNILIKEAGITTQTIDVTAPTVSVSGNIVTIDPVNFSNGAAVNIEISAGTFNDIANNNYAGITNANAWNFTIIDADLTPPTVTTYSPVDGGTNVPVSSNLVLTFNETIQKGTGNILIRESGVITQTIDVNSASVTVSGSLVTINPADFGYSTSINIEIAPGTFKDFGNNNYTGINDATTWNFSSAAVPSGPQTLVAFGTSWKYLDNGTNQGTAWTGTLFNDASWATGNAQLGYGDGDEATVVSYGPDVNNKYITTYFRKTITVSNPSAFSTISGSVKRDDGIVIYVNGTEVYRNNLATGATYTTLASLASDDGATAQTFSFSPTVFVNGDNIIAVEIHQNAGTSSDISFDLQLTGNVSGAAALIRGPYMNTGIQTGVTIRWRTDIATNSKVSYGTTVGSLLQSFTDNTVTTEHIITLTGLSPNTFYYYNIGSSSQILQGDANNYFKTMPTVGSTQKIRVLAMGDMGNNSANQVNVRNAWQSFNGSSYTDAWILMGDNAYNNGTDAEYQTNFFNIYQGSLTKNHVLWPAPGNHDYANNSARQADHLIPYYDMFSLPAAGQAGGIASGTEAFYSYNYANVHFVALDSYGWETGNTRLYDTTGPQITWLKQDLEANTQPWTVVYFHHPPYTKGSHNSDTEAELINMRQRVVRILERYKVDLVLNGHSHSYERSYLLNGHYDVENTFSAALHALSTSSAKYDGTTNSCIYIKNPADVRNGIVYAVVGSAGQLGGTTSGYPHDAMYHSDVTNGGALFFEIENNRLEAKWICGDGTIRDRFTIMKDVNKTNTITVTSGTAVNLTASWIGNYTWNTGETTKTITVTPTSDITYTVTDGAGCITDVFNITIASGSKNNTNVLSEEIVNPGLKIQPTLVHKGQPVNVQANVLAPTEAIIINIAGQVVQKHYFSGALTIQTANLKTGEYFIRLNGKNKLDSKKFIVID